MFSMLSMLSMSLRGEKMENDHDESEMKREECMKEHHERIRRHHGEMGKHPERVIVKGYMRPDGTSYYVVIPKEIREQFGLKGGEYFIVRAKPWENEIKLKLARFVEETQE
jgi:AbrB family looped-hinge helix DNA binding protein